MKDRIKVLVVDDAIVVRILVGNTISKDPDLEFIGKAENGRICLEKISELRPDVVILDIEMPEMTGLEVLKALQKQGMPTKVIMFSTYTTVGAEHTFEALELGAVDFVPKPSGAGFSGEFEKIQEELLAKIKFAGSTDLAPPIKKLRRSTSIIHSSASSYELIVFEGGMGAPKTFMNIIPQLPKDILSGILIFQPMFAGFAEQFVRRLSKNSQIEVKAAKHGDIIRAGHGLVMFGEHYVATKRQGSDLQLAFREKGTTEKYGSVPRILCESVARICKEKAIGVLMSGAGEGNIDGIRAMKEQGGLIIAEEPATLVGRQVLDQFVEKKLIDEIVTTEEIIPALTKSLRLPG